MNCLSKIHFLYIKFTQYEVKFTHKLCELDKDITWSDYSSDIDVLKLDISGILFTQINNNNDNDNF